MNILKTFALDMSNLLAISSKKSPSLIRTKTAKKSFSNVSFLGRPRSVSVRTDVSLPCQYVLRSAFGLIYSNNALKVETFGSPV